MAQFRPYEGNEPYIFVSYAHRDMDRILPIITRMADVGLRIWYDEGIDPGTDWDSNIAKHIEGCTSFVAFISASYLASDNCKDELNFARDLQKERLLIYLEDTNLPPGMAMRLNRLQAIYQYTYKDRNDFYEKLFAAPQFTDCRITVAPKHSEPDQLPEIPTKAVHIKVFGLGGGGCNAISRIFENHPECVEYIAVNTDLQGLSNNRADRKLLIGAGLPHVGPLGDSKGVEDVVIRQYSQKITEILSDADIVFLTCGLGGAAGTGAISAVARIARDMGILTVGVVTVPFKFEGSHRMKVAEDAIEHLKDVIDTLVVMHNDQLLSIATKNMTMFEAFHLADESLCQCILGISDLITNPGIIKVDINDLLNTLRSRGLAYIGTGTANGEKSLNTASSRAVSNPMLHTSLQDAKTILANITGPGNMPISEIQEASQIITDACNKNASVLLGTAISDDPGKDVRVIIIATDLTAQA